jgi:hypothetical protein
VHGEEASSLREEEASSLERSIRLALLWLASFPRACVVPACGVFFTPGVERTHTSRHTCRAEHPPWSPRRWSLPGSVLSSLRRRRPSARSFRFSLSLSLSLFFDFQLSAIPLSREGGSLTKNTHPPPNIFAITTPIYLSLPSPHSSFPWSRFLVLPCVCDVTVCVARAGGRALDLVSQLSDSC